MEKRWQTGLHRRNFISTQTDDVQDTIRLVSPISRFGIFQGNLSVDDEFPEKPYKFRTKLMITGAVVTVVVVACLVGYFIGSTDRKKPEPPDPYDPLPPSPSILHVFQRAAVCTDAPQCSNIGKDILLMNGSAVDAAIAAMFCNGFLNQQSMGIGGGFFMTVFIKDEEKAYSVNAREKAPLKAHKDMFKGNSDAAHKGPLSAAVPGEVRGMWAAHQRWGKLPWDVLLAPTLKICQEGYIMTKVLYDGLLAAPWIKNDPILRKQYFNPLKNEFYKPGSLIRPSEELCNTLRKIAEKGGDELYNGTLAAEFAADLADANTIMTADDLRAYEAKISDPIAVGIGNGDVLYAPPLPSSGVVLLNILNILRGYNFTVANINSTEDKILTYHRAIEAFKYAYATRSKLGDPDFAGPDLFDLLNKTVDPKYANKIRLQINDSMTSNDSSHYGVDFYTPNDSGTAHISIIADNGDAVSITSSINFYYGAGISLRRTGIVLNNVMDDFSSPSFINQFGVPPSPANFIQAGKRPMSSMSPSIIVDNAGNAKLVIGGSGATKITTAVAMVTMRKLWFGQTIKQAVDEARIHHQVFPMKVEYEYGVIHDILEGLKAKGHEILRYKGRGSIICAMYRNSTGIYANADFRKGGDVSGH